MCCRRSSSRRKIYASTSHFTCSAKPARRSYLSRRQALAALAGVGTAAVLPGAAHACSRVFWNDNPVKLVGRTLDWSRHFDEAMWALPAGMERSGRAPDNPAKWKSRYASLIIAGLDICTEEGINEKGSCRQPPLSRWNAVRGAQFEAARDRLLPVAPVLSRQPRDGGRGNRQPRPGADRQYGARRGVSGRTAAARRRRRCERQIGHHRVHQGRAGRARSWIPINGSTTCRRRSRPTLSGWS